MQTMTIVWLAAAILVLSAVAVRDFRRKSYWWGSVSAIMAATGLFLQVPTHAVTIDLPARAQ